MAVSNSKSQSFLSSFFIKPFNSILSYFSGLYKPRQITKKDATKDDNKQFKSNIEMKVILPPKKLTALEQCDYMLREVRDLRKRVAILQAQQDLKDQTREQDRAEASRKRIASVNAKIDNYRLEREKARSSVTPKEEKSFVSNFFRKVNIFNPKAQVFRHKSLDEILDEASKDNSYSRPYGR